VPPALARRLVALLLAATTVALAAGAGVTASTIGPVTDATSPFSEALVDARIDGQPRPELREKRLAQLPIDWRGGPITTSTGETVTVFVSPSLDPSVTPESWAEFITHLTHGPEISKLTAYFATLDEVQQVCGAQALGCYGDNELVSMGAPAIDGTTPEEIVRHEYGHHIAFNRVGTPWNAVEWGPKYWASSASVCRRVQQGSAFPGDEGLHYDQNPGEAWAETYRLLDEQKNGILTRSWQIVSSSFFPNATELQAAERDVLDPWTGPTTKTYRKQFTKKGTKVWTVRLQTPLDGNLAVTATYPKGGVYAVDLLGPNDRTVLRRGSSSGARTKRVAASVCGQRTLFVRVTEKSVAGRVSVTTSIP
jgi:hypothetical protein